MSIGRTITEISLFSSNEYGGRPPSWFLKVRTFQMESFLKGFASLCEILCREDKRLQRYDDYSIFQNSILDLLRAPLDHP